MQGRVFSGIQPTTGIHLGNYLGAIRNWVKMQASYDCIYCIVDLHALTVVHDAKEMRANTREVAAALLAAGIDPKRSILFVQSNVPAHTQLAWILNCVTPDGLAQPDDPVQGEGGQGPRGRAGRAVRLSGADGGRHPGLQGDPCAGRRGPEAASRAGARHRRRLQSQVRRRTSSRCPSR